MDELQADRRPDHGHPRRPLRRHARDRGDDHEGGHLHDGRPRDLAARRSRSACGTDREVVLEVSGLSTKDLLKDVSFELRKGEILGFAGLMGAGRTEVARAVVGADKIDAGTITAARPRDPRSTTRPRPPSTGSATCPRTASSSACCSSRRSTRTSGSARWRERFQAWGFVKDKAMRATVAGVRRHAAHQDAVGRPDGQEPLGRQPAEGRHRQVARQGLRHPHLRRADPRHRRRREGGDLPAAQRPRAAGQVDHHDLVRAARRSCGCRTASSS